MKNTILRLTLSLLTTTLTGLTLLSLIGGSALAANWTITDLGALGAPGNAMYESRAYNINNAGQVAGKGVVLIDGVLENHYVVWSNGTQIDLGIRINSSWVDSAPINDAGQVAGVIEAEGGRPFLWETGVVTPLPWLSGSLIANVASINASGTVVGLNRVWRGGVQAPVAVQWEGGILTELDTWDKVVAINDSGAIAISGGPSRVLTGGATNVVEVPVGSVTLALDLNNAGQVCGRFIDGSGGSHAFLWQQGVGGVPLREFLPFGLASRSEAVALNNLGHAVGQAANDSGNPAVLWRDGLIISLSDLPEVKAAGWSGLTARDINDHDQIVGIGYRGGLVKAFLLSPFALTAGRDRTNFVGSFPTMDGLVYDVEFKSRLGETNWSPLFRIQGNGFPQSFVDSLTNPSRFYRVIVP